MLLFQLADELPGATNAEVAREVGFRWRNLTNEERNHYFTLYEEGKAKFLAENAGPGSPATAVRSPAPKRTKKFKQVCSSYFLKALFYSH